MLINERLDVGLGSGADTEGARGRREEELVMAPLLPEGCRECVRELSPRCKSSYCKGLTIGRLPR